MQTQTLSVNQVAEILQVSPRTVRNLCIRGRFPEAYKFDHLAKRSDWIIPAQNLNEFMENRLQFNKVFTSN
ncbi:MAG: helix-turn-helix domain-containing protein [Anaerolineaceae bacterium]